MDQETINYALNQESRVNLVELRDKIAIEAMKSILTSKPNLSNSQIAGWSYELANTMLERRKQP